MQLSSILEAALPCVNEAAASVQRLFLSREFSVSEKSPGDPLTTADLQSNDILRVSVTVCTSTDHPAEPPAV